jgi:methylthioribose-1-phosphate isomerase
LIDQTLLPNELKYIACHDVETLWEAIKSLRIRGAPAIGVAAAMGVVLGLQKSPDEAQLFDNLRRVCDYLGSSRPTAVNLFWALNRMTAKAEAVRGTGAEWILETLLAEAQAIRDEDAAMCRAIGQAGADLIPENGGVLTHCNAGGLATSEYGTALALMFTAHAKGRRFSVYADETRPLLQGARLTAWELMQAGIEVTLICDSMAGQVMKEGKIQAVITGADRIAANGDAANKIGTYSVAVLAKRHEIPFYIAAPFSTFDFNIGNGDAIPIEERASEEITEGFGVRTAPAQVRCYSPAFDVTPAELITGIVTEKGLIRPVTREKIHEIFSGGPCQG